MSWSDRIQFFPNGKSLSTVAPVVLAIVSFALNADEFQLESHVPAFVALLIVLSTIVTTASPSVLVGGSVLCFVNAFFSLYYTYILIKVNPCNDADKNTSHERRLLGEENDDWKKEYCKDRLGEIEYNASSSLLWIVTGLAVLRIPQQQQAGGNYDRGHQTAGGALVQSLLERREVIKLGCFDKIGFFPHGTGYVTLSAIATAIISFALNANQFDIAVHIPAMIALVIVLCTTVTTVNSSFLVGGAVVCFVNAFLGAFYVYMMIAYNSCKDESVVFDEKEEYCASRLQDMALEALASLFWTLTGLLVLRIPQPSHAENNEQTAVFNAAPNSIDGFELA